MNKIILTLFVVLLSFNLLFSQTPYGFNYQAVARDENGWPVVSQHLVVEITIKAQTSAEIVWQEGHSVNTNEFGLFTLVIGQGTNTHIGTLSGFNQINWMADQYKVEVRIDFGNGLKSMGEVKLQSVPYSLLAKDVENKDDADADPTNEIQVLSRTGSTISLSQGGGSIIDQVNDADTSITNEIQIISRTGNTVSLSLGGGSFAIGDNDADSTNEIQDLLLTGNTLQITNNALATPVDLSAYLDNTDMQSLSLGASDTLTLTNGGTVYLGGYLDNTDNQILTLSLFDTLSITNGGEVYLGGYLDNTDNQTLSLSNDSLTISFGNTIYLPSDTSLWSLSGSDIYYTNGNVGIGTITPGSYKLNVNGRTYIGVTETTNAASYVANMTNISATQTVIGNVNGLYLKTASTNTNTEIVRGLLTEAYGQDSLVSGITSSGFYDGNNTVISMNMPMITGVKSFGRQKGTTGDATIATRSIGVWGSGTEFNKGNNYGILAIGAKALNSNIGILAAADDDLDMAFQGYLYSATGGVDGIAVYGYNPNANGLAAFFDGNIRLTGLLYDVNDSAGTAGQVLQATGTGVEWVNAGTAAFTAGTGISISNDTISVIESDIESYIENDITNNYIPYDDGTKLVASDIYYDGTNVGIGTVTPGSYKLNVNGRTYIGVTDTTNAASYVANMINISATQTVTGQVNGLYLKTASTNTNTEIVRGLLTEAYGQDSLVSGITSSGFYDGNNTVISMNMPMITGVKSFGRQKGTTGDATIATRSIGVWGSGTEFNKGNNYGILAIGAKALNSNIGILAAADDDLDMAFQGYLYSATGGVDGIAVYGYNPNANGLAAYFDGNMGLTGVLYDNNDSAGTAGQVLKATGTGIEWGNVGTSSFTGGNGIDIINDTINVDYDATTLGLSGVKLAANNTANIWNANQLQGIPVSTTGLANNKILKYNGLSWVPADDNSSAYVAGDGVDITSSTISVDYGTGLSISAGQLIANLGNGLEINAGAIQPDLGNGLTISGIEITVDYDATTMGITGTSLKANNTSGIWNANQILGTPITTTGLANGKILKYNGLSWAPADDASANYIGGDGIAIAGSTISADYGNGLTIAVGKLEANVGNGIIFNAGAMETNLGNGLVFNTGQIQANLGTGLEFGAGTTIQAALGNGLTLSGNDIVVDYDATTMSIIGTSLSANSNSAIWNADRLQGVGITTAGLVSGNILKYNGTNWVPAADNSSTIYEGDGINISNDTIIVDPGNGLDIFNNQVIADIGNGLEFGVGGVIQADLGAGLTLSGSDIVVDYDATSLGLSGNTLVANNNSAVWNANQLMGSGITTAGLANGNVLKFNGTNWVPATDNSGAVYEGDGVNISNDTISVDPGNGLDLFNNQVIADLGNGLEFGVGGVIQADLGNGLTLSGSDITLDYDATTLGISGTSLTVNYNSGIWNANQLLGTGISTAGLANGNVLKYNGVNWVPAADNSGNVYEGDGIDISNDSIFVDVGNGLDIFSGMVIANLGNGLEFGVGGVIQADLGNGLTLSGSDITLDYNATTLGISGTSLTVNNNSAIWNANQLMSTGISTAGLANGYVLKYNGVNWAPAVDNSGSVYEGDGVNISNDSIFVDVGNGLDLFSGKVIADLGNGLEFGAGGVIQADLGNGLTLSGSDITLDYDATTLAISGTSLAVNNNSAIWNANQLMGTGVSTAGLANGKVLKYNGLNWVPSDDNSATVNAGNGIDITSNTISVDYGNGLTISAAQLVPNLGNGLEFGIGGVVQADLGNGLTLSGSDITLDYDATTLAISGTSIKANNNSGIWNANQLLNAPISTAGLANGKVLKYNGLSWVPSDDNSSTYIAGDGIDLTSSTLSVDYGNGLTISAGTQLIPNLGNGLEFGVGGVIQADLGNGLTLSGSDITINYDATTMAMSGVQIKANNTASVWNANQLMGSGISTAGLANGKILKYNGLTWAPADDASANWVAGNGIDITSSTITVDYAQGLTISAGNKLIANLGNGLEFVSNAIQPKLGAGLTFSGTDITVSETSVEGFIENDITDNYIPYNNATKLVASDIYYDGTNVGIGTTTPARKLHVSDVLRLEPRAAAPASPSEGDIYVNSTSHHIYCYLNGAWVQLD